MKVIIYRKERDEKAESLWEGICRLQPNLGLQKSPVVLAVVGAGGKTSCIATLAQELKEKGKRILVVTTTHMYEPERYGVLTDNPEAIIRQLDEKGIAVAGVPCGQGKISYIGDAAFEKAAQKADIVLVEADGSRRLPFKVLGSAEPVLPRHCDAVLCLAGLSALGKPLEAVCFRWEETEAAALRFGSPVPAEAVDGRAELSVQLFSRIWQHCFLAGVPRDIPILPVLNQADTPQHRIAANLIFQEMDLPAGLITSLKGEEGIPCI